jgi:hypothetical protein
MTDRLGHKQTAVMLTLMVLAREVSNPELKGIVGFSLDGKERRELNDGGLVASRRPGQPYLHELTDSGWAWCREELKAATPPAPHARSVLVPAMYVLLSGLDGYLQREKLGLAEVFAPVVELSDEEIEKRIRKGYRTLAQSSRDLVRLSALRPLLGEAPAEGVNAVLKKLSRERVVHLAPDPNRKMLTEADHHAAIRVGGEDNHLLSIEAS